MAERDNGGAGWTAFLAGIILVAVIGLGVFAYSGGFNRQNEVAQMDVEMPDVNVDPPEINLPEPPDPQTPPAANDAPAPATETP
jgi:hypothetical protein